MKNYEILKHLPATGPMYVPISPNELGFFREGFVIRFTKLDGTDWVGNFEPGWSDFNRVFDFQNHGNVIVIAGGQGYVICPEEEKPLLTFGPSVDNAVQSEDGTVVCSDGIRAFVFDNTNGDYWVSDRISWDGIKDLKIIDEEVNGLSFDPTNEQNPWGEFSINLKTKEIKGGSFQNFLVLNPDLQADKDGVVSQKSMPKKKPWWKFWA